MLIDGKSVPEDHGGADGKDQLGDQSIQAEEIDDVHGRDGSHVLHSSRWVTLRRRYLCLALMTPSHPPVSDSPRRVRRGTLLAALWLFGIFTTVLLVGVWGRAVTSDGDTIRESARAVLGSEAVSDRVTGWIEDGVGSAIAEDLPAGLIEEAALAVWDRPETRRALDSTVDRLVEAALAPPGSSVTIDLGAILAPLLPVVVEELAIRGLAVDLSSVQSALAQVPTLVLEAEARAGVAEAVAGARSLLTTVVAFGLVGMLLSGAAAVALAEQRLRQVRSLALRVFVSAATFSILLRVGSWALDPSAGRSPIAAGGSVFLASSGHVLVLTALSTAAVAAAATAMVRRRKRGVPA